jgi:hypothetical protein
MSLTRIGKIGRLPKDIRDELGHRIEDGEPGKKLVNWLNGLSEVKCVLKEQFDGRLITEQNLSDWKQAGHPEWLRRLETRRLATSLAEQADDLEEAAAGDPISDRFASVLTAEFVMLTQKLLAEKKDAGQGWPFLREMLRELSRLRGDDHRAVGARIKRERWIRQVEREDEKADKRLAKDHKTKLCAPFWAEFKLRRMAKVFGGGEAGLDIAAFIIEVQNGLPPGYFGWTSPYLTKPAPAKANPAESSLIVPNPPNLSNRQPTGAMI